MNEPDFFLVGAPKCGTTAVSEYLRAHPRIFMCTPKEPHYFATDLPRYRYVTQWDKYQALFDGASKACLARGEASVFYLYSNVAISEIRRTLPAARLLVMLRNPLEIAVSMHAQALLTRDENVVSFAKAWALCAPRREGRDVPAHCRDSKILLYDQLPLLGRQLQRLLDVFPGSQVRWWFYEDFANEPGTVYREVLSFLGIPADGRTDFPRVNSRRSARSQLLAQFTQKTPAPLVRMAMRVKDTLGVRRLGLLDRMRRANFRPTGKLELPPALKDEMREHFALDIRLLERVTGRHLGHWLGAGS